MKKIFRPGNSDDIIERIRELGGTVFEDPAPMSKPVKDLVSGIINIFSKK